MAALELALWVLLGLGLALALLLALRLRRLEKRRSSSTTQVVKVARVRMDSRPLPKLAKLPNLPKLVEDGDDLEITVIEQVAADPLELLELEEADELRPSRVDLTYEDEAQPEEPTAPKARILMSASGDTDCGRQRTRNEDRLLVRSDRSVFVVADGMGGHAGGAIASELAVRALDEAYSRRDFRGVVESSAAIPRRARELSLAIQQANHAVYSAAVSTPRLAEMGTTLVVAKFSPRKQRVYIGHVGDSRCYRLRQGSIRQLTTDHNLASVGLHGPHDDRLVRALGIQPTVTIDLIIDRPLPNDVYCLCSDGLSKMVSDAEILEMVEQEADLEGAVRALIALANERGGRDNITVVLVRVIEAVPARFSASSA
jgi:serine/threonine protein phosphatase PrpC